MNLFEYGLTILNQVVLMALLMSVGYFLARTKKLCISTVEDLTFLVFKVVMPCVIVQSFIEVQFTAEYLSKIAIAVLLGVVSHVLGLGFGLLFLKEKDRAKSSVYRFNCLISNAGFVSIPLAQVVFGAESVLLISVYVIIINIFMWTIGKAMFPENKNSGILKMVLNPGIIGILFGIIAVLVKQFYTPRVLFDSVAMVANMNAPLAMIITGYHLVGTNIFNAVRDRNSWIVILIRHILLPVTALVLYRYLFGISGLLLTSLILPVCAPCGLISILFASTYGGDAKTASQLTSLSTIMSIITMPLVLILCQLVSQ